MAEDFKGMSEKEVTDYLLQMEIGMLAPEIRKFRRALAALNDEGGADEEEGGVDPRTAACLSFLAKANLEDIFPQIKAEAGGSVSVEDLCNPDMVSDAMLLSFELNKAEIRRYHSAGII